MLFQTHQHVISEPMYQNHQVMHDYTADAGAHNSNNIAVSESDKQRANVMAERYKTKMCRNAVSFGSCPYFEKCMFAHTPDELRTKEMNLRDGLTTEEAIRNYRRMLSLKRRFSNGPMTAVPSQQQRGGASSTNNNVTTPQSTHFDKSPFQSHQAHYRHPSMSTQSVSSQNGCQCQECLNQQVQLVSNGWYQYNPYGWSPVATELLQDKDAVCTCAQCAETGSVSPNPTSESCTCPDCVPAQSINRCGLSQASSLDQFAEQCQCAACMAACTCQGGTSSVTQMP